MVVAVKRTVYPDGSLKEYEKGMKIEINSIADTEQINKWFKEIHKALNKSNKWKKKCR
jgi:hypothetical protein